MTYIENIFVCIAAPLLVLAVYTDKKYYHFFFFCFAGMLACLLSAYINTFFSSIYKADLINATTQIAPVVEEIMKFLPLLFYLLIFNPKAEGIHTAVLIVAASFATFENICYLTQNGAAHLYFLLIRGFSTGAMHIVCGIIVSYGLAYAWQHSWLRIAGSFGLLCAAIIFHAIYNLLIAYGNTAQYIAYALPLLTVSLQIIVNKIVKNRLQE